MKTNLLFGTIALVIAIDANAGALVAAKDSPIAPFDIEEAQRIFLGHDTAVNGQTITLVFQKDGSTRTTFEDTVVGMSGTKLTSYLFKGIFTGRMKPPAEVDTDTAVKTRVNLTPGAIGYINNDAIDSSVKVLLKY